VVDGEVIGGIGASFATPEDDEQVARAGLAALSKQLESGACFGPWAQPQLQPPRNFQYTSARGGEERD